MLLTQQYPETLQCSYPQKQPINQLQVFMLSYKRIFIFLRE